MNEATSLSLLRRAVTTGDVETWERLVALYAPLLRRWLARYEVQAADADDLIQEVFSVVAQELPAFNHSGQNGTWFDDLELIAYNRDKLPTDFDARHGRNNRMK